jgi:hypothetical protein
MFEFLFGKSSLPGCLYRCSKCNKGGCAARSYDKEKEVSVLIEMIEKAEKRLDLKLKTGERKNEKRY